MNLQKALIISVMTYACHAWEFAADSHLIKLHRVKKKFPCTIANSPRRTPGREMHMTFHLPYVYDYMTILCMQQAEIFLNHDNGWHVTQLHDNQCQKLVGLIDKTDSIAGLKIAVIVMSSYYKNRTNDGANTGTPVGRSRKYNGQNKR
jgi:hypothetical protein